MSRLSSIFEDTDGDGVLDSGETVDVAYKYQNLLVRGYKEEGTTTTPFDMAVLNDLDRFHLAGDVIDRVPQLGAKAAYVKQALPDKLIEHKQYITKHGEDMPEIRDWKWGGNGGG
jgi:xylulose-5-phosphate/fructose-6-phosphate phosphoketolase